jgi:hypothetical protein
MPKSARRCAEAKVVVGGRNHKIFAHAEIPIRFEDIIRRVRRLLAESSSCYPCDVHARAYLIRLEEFGLRFQVRTCFDMPVSSNRANCSGSTGGLK